MRFEEHFHDSKVGALYTKNQRAGLAKKVGFVDSERANHKA
jgi:hypothetical protein